MISNAYWIVPLACFVIVCVLLAVGIASAAKRGDEQLAHPAPESDWDWPLTPAPSDGHEMRIHASITRELREVEQSR